MSLATDATATIAASVLRKAALIVGGAALLSLAAGLAYFWWQNGRMREQQKADAAEIAVIQSVNAANVVGRARAEEDLFWRELAVAGVVTERNGLAAQLRAHRLKYREALQDAKVLDSPAHPDFVDSLCMQHKAANGGRVPGDPFDAAGSLDATQADSPAARCGEGSAWRLMTWRDAIEYASLLLEHAGEEALDKSGQRAWVHAVKAARNKAGGGTE